MIYQKYIARCYRVYQHERNENASFLSIFNGGGRPKWRFSNFPRFWKNSSALGSFNCIFENNSLKALFGQNMKKLKILKLSPDSRYLQNLALKHATMTAATSKTSLNKKHRRSVKLYRFWFITLKLSNVRDFSGSCVLKFSITVFKKKKRKIVVLRSHSP